MLAFHESNSLLALAVILTVGFALGRIRVAGLSLGSAPILIVAVLLIGLTALTFALVTFSGADAITGAGMFAGAVSSTPGMAAILAAVPDILPAGSDPDAASAAVVGYSLAYPGGVLGIIIVAALGARLLRVDHVADAKTEGVLAEKLHYIGIRIGPARELTVAQVPEFTGAKNIPTRVAGGGAGSDGDGTAPEPASRRTPRRVARGCSIMVNRNGRETGQGRSHAGRTHRHGPA